jgi:hypothetical protein
MKSSIRQAKYSRSTGLKVVMALAFVSLVSGLSTSSALADRHDDHDRGGWHGDHHSQRESRDHREGHGHWREHQRRDSYERPIYVPPPVYYEPRQSSGFSFFFPFDSDR